MRPGTEPRPGGRKAQIDSANAASCKFPNREVLDEWWRRLARPRQRGACIIARSFSAEVSALTSGDGFLDAGVATFEGSRSRQSRGKLSKKQLRAEAKR